VVLQPLLDIKGIRARQDTIQELIENSSLRQDLRQLLRQIYDLERLTGRAVWQCQCARFSSFGRFTLRLPELARFGGSAVAVSASCAESSTSLEQLGHQHAPIWWIRLYSPRGA